MKLVATQDIRVTLNGSDFRISDVN
jgi:hypothetical protein